MLTFNRFPWSNNTLKNLNRPKYPSKRERKETLLEDQREIKILKKANPSALYWVPGVKMTGAIQRMANDRKWKLSGSTSVKAYSPRQNRPRNTLLAGIKIYLNGAPHYPARSSIVHSLPSKMEWLRGGRGKGSRNVATARKGESSSSRRMVRGRQEGNVENQEKRSLLSSGRNAWRWILFFLSRTHNASEQRAGEQIRHVFKYNTDSLASRQSMAWGMRASKGWEMVATAPKRPLLLTSARSRG